MRAVAFTARPRSLLDELPARGRGTWDDLDAPGAREAGRPRGPRVLGRLGTDLTGKAAELSLPLGLPRSPYREQLQLLLNGPRKRPTLVVGPPRVGKSTLLHRWVHDLLVSEDYEGHRNLDRVHHVWQVSGQRVISGMSHLGDWEQRCMDLLQDARDHRVVLRVDDIAALGRLGRTRDSDCNLAEFFRGPVGRGDVVMVGECTPAQLQRLEDEAPSFAAHFSRVLVEETSPQETLRMALGEARQLELEHQIAFAPGLFDQLLQLSASLLSNAAQPGKALQLERLGRRMSEHLERMGRSQPGGADVHALFMLDSMRTALRRLKGRAGRLHARRGGSRDQVLQVLAEVEFAGRSLASIDDPWRHEVFVELLHLGLVRRIEPLGAAPRGGREDPRWVLRAAPPRVSVR